MLVPGELEPSECVIRGRILDPLGARATNCGDRACRRVRRVQANTAAARKKAQAVHVRSGEGCGEGISTTS